VNLATVAIIYAVKREAYAVSMMTIVHTHLLASYTANQADATVSQTLLPQMAKAAAIIQTVYQIIASMALAVKREKNAVKQAMIAEIFLQSILFVMIIIIARIKLKRQMANHVPNILNASH